MCRELNAFIGLHKFVAIMHLRLNIKNFLQVFTSQRFCESYCNILVLASYGRSSLKVGGDVVKPASSFRHPGPVIYNILWRHDVMGIPELNGMCFDLMSHIHRLILKQVPTCAWMTGIFQHQCEAG